jgi:hypothetical protein
MININSLKSSGSLAQRYGVKCLIYGGPGSGKTPLMATASNSVACITEPGTLSLRGTNFPAIECFNSTIIDEFFEWFLKSNESAQFQTLFVDSVSQLAELYLETELKLNKDGRQAYGKANARTYDQINKLYFLPNKNIVLIAKQCTIDEGGVQKRKPYFPGIELNVKIPHMYDEILHLGIHVIPKYGQQKALRCRETFDVVARDRSGKLNEFEPPDLNSLFAKCLS